MLLLMTRTVLASLASEVMLAMMMACDVMHQALLGPSPALIIVSRP